MPEQVAVWKAQEGPQSALIACPVFEVFFGGARGGGKTDGSLGDWMEHSNTYKGAATGVFFRRTYRQLSEVMARAHEIFTPLGAKFNGEKAQWTMPGGGRLLFRYLDKDSDADEYQGHNYTRIYIEEATNFPSPAPINKLKATLRSARGVPVGIRLTGNPGGPGHGWVKNRYIDPAPEGYKVLSETFTNPFNNTSVSLDRVFIPSQLKDNQLLMSNDPTYVARLYQAGSKDLVNAWLLGLWDRITGAFFSEFEPGKHVLDAGWLDYIPRHSYCFRAIDWGFAKPYSVGWYVVADGTWSLPRGALVRFEELYGYGGQPNEGTRQNIDQVARSIKARDQHILSQYGLRVRPGVADPAMFQRHGGPSMIEQMIKNGVIFGRGDNKRDPGWQQIRRRFAGPTPFDDDGLPLPITDDRPLLYIVETCEHLIRTLPLAQHSETNPEDLDTDGEDHALDELRYACMSRPLVNGRPVDPADDLPTLKLPSEMTFMDMVRQNQKRLRARRARY